MYKHILSRNNSDIGENICNKNINISYDLENVVYISEYIDAEI